MKALVLTGEGYGNIIMSTPLIRAVEMLGYDTHVLVDSRWDDAHLLIRPPSYKRIDDLPDIEWDVVVGTAWRPRASVKAKRRLWPDCTKLYVKHESRVNMECARILGFNGPTPKPFCRYSEGPQLPQPYIVFCPGFGGRKDFWKRKAWPHWKSLIRYFPNSVGLGASDEEIPTKYRFFGDLTITQAADVLRRACAVVSVDNGLAHISAALGTPTFVLFGATSEVKNKPFGSTVLSAKLKCRPCQNKPAWDRCKNWVCMKNIIPNQVLSELARRRIIRYNNGEVVLCQTT